GPARDAIRDECGKGVLGIQWGPADEAFAVLLPHLRAAFAHASSRFEGARREARVLGFADLELHALRALEHEEVRRHYRGRWKAVLVDEFQDTNPVHARILERLAEDAMLTAVGDENQSSSGSRGAAVGESRSFGVKILEAAADDLML